MRQLRWVGLAALLVASVALAGPKTVKLTPKQGVTAEKVAKATNKVQIGQYQNGDDPLTVWCSGQGPSLTCEAQQADGVVVAKSSTFEAGDGVVILTFASPEGPYKLVTAKVEIPGGILKFGGQGMGEF